MRTLFIGKAPLPFADIQGLILRGYTHPKGRHFVLHFPDRASGRKFVAAIRANITTAAPWTKKPPHCINIGLTADGLTALGVPVSLSTNFPPEFIAGAIGRATNVGDTGDSAPAQWEMSLGTPNQAHAILSTVAIDDASRNAVTTQLNALFQSTGITSLGFHDADDLPDSFVHFGYRDSISQPNIDGAPMKKYGLDSQPLVATGEFVTGYPNQSGTVIPVPVSDEFGKNGSYAAFRILEQNVEAFFAYIDAQATQLGVDPEMIKANFCGRHTDGTPLAGTTGSLNDFDYSNDPNGQKCPYDAHIRRSHPRNSFMFGPPPAGEGYRHRILRRAMPYGPEYNAVNPVTASRGLIGHFMGASLGQQFEFVMSQWVNGVTVGNDFSDALIGANGDTVPTGNLQMANGKMVNGFARFTQTRGSAYVFFPSITGLHSLGNQS
jgi:deferrochelatase/peroxidase EfeB